MTEAIAAAANKAMDINVKISGGEAANDDKLKAKETDTRAKEKETPARHLVMRPPLCLVKKSEKYVESMPPASTMFKWPDLSKRQELNLEGVQGDGDAVLTPTSHA
eukprot:CAMPEP_0118948408 /NCGR_PEP_ID=MMETSP1169-20130426/47773_1 /TAXON_ID=36882 /ORGANISM="Pyramimonas obovata, Strain CCMP722" /LENGTH=105 /DNA_ID=CAMNT_0006894823 /DNA_START=169 /DNA_END=484 /DNA_ORIENTATION=+